jgi:hypothetical protein
VDDSGSAVDDAGLNWPARSSSEHNLVDWLPRKHSTVSWPASWSGSSTRLASSGRHERAARLAEPRQLPSVRLAESGFSKVLVAGVFKQGDSPLWAWTFAHVVFVSSGRLVSARLLGDGHRAACSIRSSTTTCCSNRPGSTSPGPASCSTWTSAAARPAEQLLVTRRLYRAAGSWLDCSQCPGLASHSFASFIAWH